MASNSKYDSLVAAGNLGEWDLFRAHDVTADRDVLLGTYRNALANSNDEVRLKFALLSVASLSHPGLAQVHEVLDWNSRVGITQAFIHGRKLAEYSPTDLNPELIRFVLNSIAAAIDYVHAQGLAHGRITAQSVIIDEFDGSVRLYDLAFSVGSSAVSRSIAPRRADHRSLGLLAVSLLRASEGLGESGHSGGPEGDLANGSSSPNLPNKKPALPADAEALLRRMVSGENSSEFPSALEFVKALERSLEEDHADPPTDDGLPNVREPQLEDASTAEIAHQTADASSSGPSRPEPRPTVSGVWQILRARPMRSVLAALLALLVAVPVLTRKYWRIEPLQPPILRPPGPPALGPLGPEPGRAGSPAGRLTGWSFLGRQETEAKAYGLYSYVLFGARGAQGSERQARYVAAVQALLEVEAIDSLRRVMQIRDLNITYMPVVSAFDVRSHGGLQSSFWELSRSLERVEHWVPYWRESSVRGNGDWRYWYPSVLVQEFRDIVRTTKLAANGDTIDYDRLRFSIERFHRDVHGLREGRRYVPAEMWPDIHSVLDQLSTAVSELSATRDSSRRRSIVRRIKDLGRSLQYDWPRGFVGSPFEHEWFDIVNLAAGIKNAQGADSADLLRRIEAFHRYFYGTWYWWPYESPELHAALTELSQALSRVPNAETVIADYDFARAQVFLQRLSGPHADGPYIVSTPQPLSQYSRLPDERLYQDLSTVPPRLVRLWIREFILQARQERFWVVRGREQFVIRLRTTLGQGADVLPEVDSAIRRITWSFRN